MKLLFSYFLVLLGTELGTGRLEGTPTINEFHKFPLSKTKYSNADLFCEHCLQFPATYLYLLMLSVNFDLF